MSCRVVIKVKSCHRQHLLSASVVTVNIIVIVVVLIVVIVIIIICRRH
jgi:hypothetical protein